MFANACNISVERLRQVAAATGLNTGTIDESDVLTDSQIERFANVLTSERRFEARVQNINALVSALNARNDDYCLWSDIQVLSGPESADLMVGVRGEKPLLLLNDTRTQFFSQLAHAAQDVLRAIDTNSVPSLKPYVLCGFEARLWARLLGAMVTDQYCIKEVTLNELQSRFNQRSATNRSSEPSPQDEGKHGLTVEILDIGSTMKVNGESSVFELPALSYWLGQSAGLKVMHSSSIGVRPTNSSLNSSFQEWVAMDIPLFSKDASLEEVRTLIRHFASRKLQNRVQPGGITLNPEDAEQVKRIMEGKGAANFAQVVEDLAYHRWSHRVPFLGCSEALRVAGARLPSPLPPNGIAGVDFTLALEYLVVACKLVLASMKEVGESKIRNTSLPQVKETIFALLSADFGTTSPFHEHARYARSALDTQIEAAYSKPLSPSLDQRVDRRDVGKRFWLSATQRLSLATNSWNDLLRTIVSTNLS